MKASELRLRNYLTSDLHKGLVCEVWSVLSHDKVKINLNPVAIYDVSELSPIPLTEEWLLKLGLDKQNHFKEWKVDNKYSVFLYEGNYRLQAETVLGSYTVARVIYIHQLQNLYYALTGEELTIKE